jgi:O-antigen/teichoic acid export membrane protein
LLKKLIPESRYARNVITLMTGTTLAQAIPIAISPILTRLYSPEEFGRFALYMAVAMIASVLVTGRYELAILLPRQDKDALHVAALAMALSIAISGVLFFVVFFFAQPIAALLGDATLTPWLYWVPASTLLLGLYQSLNYWSNRKAGYKRMAISRTVQSSSAALGQLASGYVGSGAVGLIGGQISGQVLATAVLARLIWRDDREQIRALHPLRSLALAKKYIDFPKYLIVAHGFNTASGQMPVLLLSALFNTTAAGFFTLTQRVMAAPMSLVAGALGDVFRQEASLAYVQKGQCTDIYQKTFKRLLLISVCPFAVFFFVAPVLFAWLFGEQWRVAGEYAQILTPMAFLQFITSPLSSMYMIAEKQKVDLLWQVCLFAFVVISFFWANIFSSEKAALAIFSSVYCLMYGVNGLISYLLAIGRWRNRIMNTKTKSVISGIVFIARNIYAARKVSEIKNEKMGNLLFRGYLPSDASIISEIYQKLNNGNIFSRVQHELYSRIGRRFMIVVEHGDISGATKIVGMNMYYLNRRDVKENTVHEGFIGVEPMMGGRGIAIKRKCVKLRFSISCRRIFLEYQHASHLIMLLR